MNIQQLENDHKRIRREVLTRRILHGLKSTLRLRPVGPNSSPIEARIEFTDESARFIAPLVDAVEILEAIIYASDGCMGHQDCAHSTEPWRHARALLSGKWEADERQGNWP